MAKLSPTVARLRSIRLLIGKCDELSTLKPSTSLGALRAHIAALRNRINVEWQLGVLTFQDAFDLRVYLQHAINKRRRK